MGNKQDSNEIIQVDEETGKKLAASKNMNYVETSALNGNQVSMAFEIMARELISKKNVTQQKGNKLVTAKVTKKLWLLPKIITNL